MHKIHLHLFRSDTWFRVHLAIHVKDADDWGLNGIDSSGFPGQGPRRYNFRFNRLEDSIDRCVSELVAYCDDVAEPWFARYDDMDRLLHDANSPLYEESKVVLRKRLGM